LMSAALAFPPTPRRKILFSPLIPPAMASWTSETLKGVYTRLLESGVEFVVIGGQAVNLWSRHFSSLR
jgi:hypothetical protein